MVANRAGGIRLAGEDYVRPGPGPSTATRNTQASHGVHKGGCVPCLAAGQNERKGTAAAVGSKMNLRRQSTARPADGVIIRLHCQNPFSRAPAAC